MKKKWLKIPILLLIVLLLVVLTLVVAIGLNPVVFWVLAVLSAVFAFVILPRIRQ
ncbi:MAG: hypothetical protein ABIE23_00650 [archaeon]|nr:hypothetical protein [Candidatus Micrarchaeota archaeon]